jgi:hypothetical protein
MSEVKRPGRCETFQKGRLRATESQDSRIEYNWLNLMLRSYVDSIANPKMNAPNPKA